MKSLDETNRSDGKIASPGMDNDLSFRPSQNLPDALHNVTTQLEDEMRHLKEYVLFGYLYATNSLALCRRKSPHRVFLTRQLGNEGDWLPIQQSAQPSIVLQPRVTSCIAFTTSKLPPVIFPPDLQHRKSVAKYCITICTLHINRLLLSLRPS